MAPPVGETPSASSLARILFGDKTPSIGKSKSRASASSKGSKRKATEAASSHNVAFGASGSSSTPAAERISIPSKDTNPCQADGGGSNGSSSGSGTQTSEQQQAPANPSLDEDVIVIEDGTLEKKRSKKCTSDVWQYLEKKEKIVEVDGKKYVQVWGHCTFPRCKASYRAESYQGTSGFWNHLRSSHSIVKGQAILKAEKNHAKGVTVVEPYNYIWQ